MVESAPDAALDALLSAVAERDLSPTIDALSASHQPTVVGSEAGETARGAGAVAAFFRRIYAHQEGFRFDLPERSWAALDDVTWVVAEGTVAAPGEIAPKPCRLTAVFVREDTGWRLVLWSGSEPV